MKIFEVIEDTDDGMRSDHLAFFDRETDAMEIKNMSLYRTVIPRTVYASASEYLAYQEEVTRNRALTKLTHEERRVLGLV